MSWPLWNQGYAQPQPQQPQMTGAYTAEQWAAMQQQNWQQWGQWQQYSQWQQPPPPQTLQANYSAKIGDSAVAQPPLPPPPEVAPPPPPPPPHENNLPLFNNKPNVKQNNFNNAQNLQKPPVLNAQQPPVQNIAQTNKQSYSNTYRSYRNDQGYGDRNDKVHGDENNQGYGDENDQEYKVDEDPGYGDWSDRGHGNQDDRGYNVQKEQYQSKDQDRNKTFGNQPWNQQNDRRGEYQNRDRGTDYRGNYNDRGNSRNAVHGPFNDQIPQKRTRYDDEYDSGRQSTNDSKWNAPSRTDTPVRNTNEPPPSANEKTDEERDFDVQFEKWELEFQKWKEQNANHPDKVAYREYEQKFETCRVQLLERRRQMLLKRTMKTNVSAPVAAAVSQPEEALPSPNNDNGDNWQDYNDYLPPDDEDDNGGLFPSADKSKGIPGLDLVESNSKDDNESPKDNNDDDVIVVNEKIIIDDDNDNSVVSVDDMKKDTAPARMLTLPENLNSILGNRSLMDALSMVKQSGAIQSKPVPSIPAIPSLMSNLIQAPVSVSNSNLKMNVLVSSDQPPQLERPVQPAQPVRPFQPSQQAVRPFQPGQQPVRPFQPAQPVRLNQLPQQPGQPFQPAQQPVRPFQSAHQPFQHAQPVRPNQPPQQAVRPFQSAHQPFQPAQPVRPNQSTQQPIQPFQPARPVRPFQSAHPGQLFQPAQPVQTARPVRPMQPRFPQPQQNRYAQPQVQLQQRPALNPQLLNPQLQAAAQLAAQQLNLPGLNLLGIQTQLQTLLGNQQLASLLGAVSHQAVGTAISPANQDQKPPQVPVKPNNGSQQKSNLYDMTPVELAAAAESSKPTWSEESVVEPHVMVDYNHKSTKSAATDFFEPAQTFDYDHLSKTNQELAKPVDDTWRDIDDYHKRTGVKVIDYQNKSLREPTAERRGRPEERWGGEERRRGPRREERDTRERRSSRERERERRPSRERRRSLERYRRSSRERGRDESRERRNFLDRVYSKDRRSPREREQKPEDIQRVENQQPPFPVTEPANETIVVLDDPPSHFDEPLEDVQPQVHRHLEQKIVMIDDILEEPGRNMRPEKIVIIMRGLPGSGKTYLAKLIKDREIENGGSAPRALSIDDYFLTEVDNFITDPNTGKKVKITNQKYEFDAANELAYLKSLHKAFKRTISDGYFNFVIFDCNNEIISDILECANVAKQANFQVYICEMENDVSACHKRNIHERSLEDIEQIYSRWQRLPNSLVKLDCTTLLQNAAIDDVDMEDALDDEDLPEVEEQAEKEEEVPRLFASKWDRTDDIDKLARLDGTSKPLRSTAGTMEDYLQLDDWQAQKTAQPGKKTVRWADIEERREQEKMRAIGFVVGQTNWDRMTDPTQGSAALTQTKYIERVGRY